MVLTRRQYVQYAGGAGGVLISGVAGCAGAGPDETPPADTDGDDTNETRPAGTGGPGISLTATDETTDLSIQPVVEVVRETATAEHPPQLRTQLTNTSDESVTVGEGRAVHFEYVSDDDGILTLLPERGNNLAASDCWRLTDTIVTTEEYRTVEIGPGETSSRLVDLYATVDADGCLPVGAYRFETQITVRTDGGESESSATWGFSVTLE